MARLDTLNFNDLYKETADLAREHGVASEQAWKELVEKVLQGHLHLAEFDEDQEIEAIRTKLEATWEEYKRTGQVESMHAIDEDPRAPHE